MANSVSEKEKQNLHMIACELYDNMEKDPEFYDVLPDVGIDRSLQKYSVVNSVAVLRNSISESLKRHDSKNKDDPKMRTAPASNLPNTVREIGLKMALATPFPLAVGLGALVISMVLEKKLKIQNDEVDGSAQFLQRIFADEKEQEVRNLIDEYLKRHVMYIDDETKLKKELQSMERKLSVQLTRLKNSMTDGHINSRTMKIWANGAAFHVQMLIHLVRLEKGDSRPAQFAIETYQKDLMELLEKYKEYKVNTITMDDSPLAFVRFATKNSIKNTTKSAGVALGAALTVPLAFTSKVEGCEKYYRIKDRETGKEALVTLKFPRSWNTTLPDVVKVFTDCMVSKFDQITGIKTYFADAEKNLENLVTDYSAFDATSLNPIPFVKWSTEEERRVCIPWQSEEIQDTEAKELSPQKKDLSSRKEEMGTKTKKLSPDGEDLRSRKEEAGTETKELSPEEEDLSSEEEDQGTETKELSPEEEDLSSRKEEAGTETKELSPEEVDLGTKMKELSPEEEDLSSSKEEAGTEMKELSPEEEDLGTETKKLSPEKEDLSPEEEDLSSRKEEMYGDTLFAPTWWRSLLAFLPIHHPQPWSAFWR